MQAFATAALLLLAAATLIALLILLVQLLRYRRRMPRLRGARVDEPDLPAVSVVIAARNEERKIAPALSSVLALDYPDLEVIVVEDRSTDGTGRVLEDLAAKNSRLHVLHVTELRPGWLGKNHALDFGARHAVGELILFTDADVHFEPTVLKRAVAIMRARRLDHLAATFKVITPSVPLALFVSAFVFYFNLYAKPWLAANPKSRAHIGIGAFNLVRRECYLRAGGHAPIAMRPDDDMKLGKILKNAGARQDLADAEGLIEVEWYASMRELVDGLLKNSFAGVDYSVAAAGAATLAGLAVGVWPFVALLLTKGWLLAMNALIALLLVGMVAGSARRAGGSGWYAIAFPLTTLLFLYVLWRSCILTLAYGGIRWRDTFYPLEELRRNKV